MDEHEEIRKIMIECSPTNLYSGIDRYRQYAKRDPMRAFEIGWEKVTNYADEDSGMLITEILSILSPVCFARLQDRLLTEWKDIDQEHRRAIISAAGRNDVLPLCTWLKIFDHEQSTVHDRHLLIAALSSGAYSKEFSPFAICCIAKVGRYDQEYQNDVLLQFLERVRKFYSER